MRSVVVVRRAMVDLISRLMPAFNQPGQLLLALGSKVELSGRPWNSMRWNFRPEIVIVGCVRPKFPRESFAGYATRLGSILRQQDWSQVEMLADALARAWQDERQVFICGNGGSAANAMHMANDFLYGVAKSGGKGIRVSALPANVSTVTCLANDLGYDQIFSAQLATRGSKDDLLIVLSGSGNSPNVINALKEARSLEMTSFAIVGFSGGTCKELADVAIHFAVDDMQIAEDLQLIVGHMLSQALHNARSSGSI
jgi:D-sedoheptulose 7-phosphate isomerase